MLREGDIVQGYKRDPKNTGYLVDAGIVRLLKPVGTVSNFWDVMHPKEGQIRMFVYEEDLIRRGLSVIQGGKSDDTGLSTSG